VQSFDDSYIHVFKNLINNYSAVPKFKIQELQDVAKNEGYKIFLIGIDPDFIETFIQDLNQPYPHDLNITLKNFQLRG
jgi:UDP-N-acetyl-D-mannosaminuronic acid transferase (WecB/TagA/CpsF family)